MASLSLLAVPVDGQEFLDLDAMTRALEDWAVKQKFSFRVERRDRLRASWVCTYADEGCEWRCRASHQSRDELWSLHVTTVEHTCVKATPRGHGPSSRKEWLDRVVAEGMNVASSTTPQMIQEFVWNQYAEEIEYKRAQETRLRLLDKDIGAQRRSFQLLAAYKQLIESTCPTVHLDLARDRHDRFERIFICPNESRESFSHCRNLLVVDGIPLKSRLVLTLLLAVAMDANGEGVVLSWAVVESEDKTTWAWFFQHLRWAIPDLTTQNLTLVSDRQNGLFEAEKVLGPKASSVWCCEHIKDEFITTFGKGLTGHFWAIARAPNIQRYTEMMEKLRLVRPDAASYLEGLLPSSWATSLCSVPRYGQDTRGLIDIQKTVLKLDKELAILPLLDNIWHTVMDNRATRRTAALQLLEDDKQTVPFVERILLEAGQFADAHQVQLSSPTVGRVTQNGQSVFVVNLDTQTCTCSKYQAHAIPCAHAISVIAAAGKLITDYVPSELSPQVWADTYKSPLPIIDTSVLQVNPDDQCEPPMTRVPRGRSPKEGVRKGDKRSNKKSESSVTHCGLCGETGHNRRRCPNPDGQAAEDALEASEPSEL